MSHDSVLPTPILLGPATRWVMGSFVVALGLGVVGLWLGVTKAVPPLWGFGLASMLLVPSALSTLGRIRGGLGNQGLERERLTLRLVSHLLRLLALGLAVASGLILQGPATAEGRLETLGAGLLATLLLGGLWLAKRGMAGQHPTLAQDAYRTRNLLGHSVLLLLAGALAPWFAWATGVTGLAMALGLFLEARTLAKGTTLPTACGGCGSGCGCG